MASVFFSVFFFFSFFFCLFLYLLFYICFGLTRHARSSTIHNTAGSSWTVVLSYVAHLCSSETKTSDRASAYMTNWESPCLTWHAWLILMLSLQTSKCLVKCVSCHCQLFMLFVCACYITNVLLHWTAARWIGIQNSIYRWRRGTMFHQGIKRGECFTLS